MSFQGHCFVNTSVWKIQKLQELTYSRLKLDVGHNLMRRDITRRVIHSQIKTRREREDKSGN
jgi:hypothetical protein